MKQMIHTVASSFGALVPTGINALGRLHAL